MANKIKPSLYVSFPVRHEIDGENVLESEPGWVELVENKAPAVGAENFVVKIHQNLVLGDHCCCCVERKPNIMSVR